MVFLFGHHDAALLSNLLIIFCCCTRVLLLSANKVDNGGERGQGQEGEKLLLDRNIPLATEGFVTKGIT